MPFSALLESIGIPSFGVVTGARAANRRIPTMRGAHFKAHCKAQAFIAIFISNKLMRVIKVTMRFRLYPLPFAGFWGRNRGRNVHYCAPAQSPASAINAPA